MTTFYGLWVGFFFLWSFCDSLHCRDNKQLGLYFPKRYSDHVKKQRRYSFFPALKILSSKTSERLALYIYIQNITSWHTGQPRSHNTFADSEAYFLSFFFFWSNIANWVGEPGCLFRPCGCGSPPLWCSVTRSWAALQFVLFDRETTTEIPCRGRSSKRQLLQSNC